MAKTVVEMTGDEAKLLRAMQKVINQQTEAQQALKKTAQESKRGAGEANKLAGGFQKAGASLRAALSPSALTRITSMTSALTAAGVAAAAAANALRRVNEVREQAAEGLKSAATGLGPLSELAGGNQQKLNQLVAAAMQTRTEGGATSAGAAGRLIFQLESGGNLDQRLLFSRLGIVTEEGGQARIAEAVAALQKATEGKAGGASAVLSALAAAAGPAPGTSIESAAAGLARAVPFTGSAGLSFTQSAGAFSILAERLGNPDLASTQLAALSSKLTEKGLQGSITDIVADIQGRGLSNQELRRFFGEQNAFAAFTNLAGSGAELANRITAVETGIQERRILDIIRAAEANPILRSVRQERAAAGRVEVARINEGIEGLDRARRKAEFEALAREGGASPLHVEQSRQILEPLLNNLPRGINERLSGFLGVGSGGPNDPRVIGEQLDIQRQMLIESRKQTEELREMRRKAIDPDKLHRDISRAALFNAPRGIAPNDIDRHGED